MRNRFRINYVMIASVIGKKVVTLRYRNKPKNL